MGNSMTNGVSFEDTPDNNWRHNLEHRGTKHEAAGPLRDGARYNDGTFTYEGQELFYRHLQLNSPRAVVFLLHGFGISSFELGVCGQKCRSLGLESFAVDFAGHGRTPGSGVGEIHDWRRELRGATCAWVQYMLHEHADRLRGLPVFIYGISMGGAIAFQVAHAMPATFTGGVILVSPLFRIAELPPKWLLGVLRVLRRVMPRFPVGSHRNDMLTRDPVKAQWIETSGKYYKIEGKVKACTADELVDMGLDCVSKFSTFTLPFMAMHGSGDTYTCYNSTREFFAKAPVSKENKHLKMFDGAYHVLLLETDDVIEEHWERFGFFVDERIALLESHKMAGAGVGAPDDVEAKHAAAMQTLRSLARPDVYVAPRHHSGQLHRQQAHHPHHQHAHGHASASATSAASSSSSSSPSAAPTQALNVLPDAYDAKTRGDDERESLLESVALDV